MKRSASVKLLGRGSGVVKLILSKWWWHLNVLEQMKRSASVKLLGRGSGVTSSKCCHRVVVAFKCSGTSPGA